jgi:Protein of unknown function (DUF3667)
MVSTSQTVCLNCATKLLGAHCHQCGQRAATGRFTWHSLLHAIPHSIFHVDRGIVPTLVGLVRHPGRTINAYLDGQRARYFNPLTLLALSASLYTLLYNYDPIWQALARSFPERSQVDVARAMALLTRWYSLSLVLLMPLAAGANWLVFRSNGRNFAEHLVILAFVNVISTLVLIPLFPPMLILSWIETDAASAWMVRLYLIGFVVSLCYQSAAAFAVFHRPGQAWRTSNKIALATLLTFVPLIGLGMLLAAAIGSSGS